VNVSCDTHHLSNTLVCHILTMPCVAACCSVLQCVSAFHVLQCVGLSSQLWWYIVTVAYFAACCSVWQRVAVCCGVLHAFIDALQCLDLSGPLVRHILAMSRAHRLLIVQHGHLLCHHTHVMSPHGHLLCHHTHVMSPHTCHVLHSCIRPLSSNVLHYLPVSCNVAVCCKMRSVLQHVQCVAICFSQTCHVL